MTEQELARRLLESGRLNREHVEYAAQQRTPDRSFAQVLVDLGWVSREEVLQIDPNAFDATPGQPAAGQPQTPPGTAQPWQPPPSGGPVRSGPPAVPSGPAPSPIPEPTGYTPQAAYAQSYQPVNGTLILVFGILGLVCCGFLAPVAWIMGNSALQAIDAGQGDPSQRQMVVVGRILGMIGTVLLVLGFFFYLAMFMFGMMAPPSSSPRPAGSPF